MQLGSETSASIAKLTPITPKVGISPNPAMAGVPVTFNVNATASITRIEADYNGDGVVDQTDSNATATLRYTYPAPGTYQARFKITDSQNQTLNKSATVIVQDVRSVDSQIQAVYQNMLDNLRQRNIPGAVGYFTPGAAEKYSAVFTSLGEQLPAAAADLGALQGGAIGDGLGEYLIVRNTPQGPSGFLIYFLLGEDGLWRIGSM